VPLLIIDPPGRGQLPPLAATNKCLAQSNKTLMGRQCDQEA
jgi:hypothetical protein